MIELLITGAAIVAMYRIAEAEDRSGWLWGALTFLFCLTCYWALPFPFPPLNVAIGFFLAFMSMTAMKIVATRR
jgi:hypothetical protein